MKREGRGGARVWRYLDLRVDIVGPARTNVSVIMLLLALVEDVYAEKSISES